MLNEKRQTVLQLVRVRWGSVFLVKDWLSGVLSSQTPIIPIPRAPACRLIQIATWLILPVVICLSQRLSHACLSINNFILWNCEWLIKSVIVYLIIPYYLDNRGNSRANTCYFTRLLEGWYWLDTKPTRATGLLVIHSHFSNRMTLCRRWFIQISALSTFDGKVVAYHGFNG